MRTKTIFTISLLFLAQLAFSQSSLKRKTTWALSEVKEWAENNKNTPTWHGWLLYQGPEWQEQSSRTLIKSAKYKN